MKTILLYLLQVTICSGILYSYYHFFLRNKKFHQYNRLYLLAITIASLVVPLLNIPVYFNSQQDIPPVYQVLSAVRVGGGEKEAVAINFPAWQTMAWLFYGFIASLIFIRFCMALLKLIRILNKYQAEKMNEISFINTNEEGTPYSFFYWLFWNKNISLDSASGKQIFRHEMFHIQQKHSWDMVFTELLTIIFWINPFFHLIKKEIKTIHEFLADQFATSDDDKWEYAELLVMQVLQTRQRLVNPFFHNQIKRRIAMITNSSKTSYQYLRKLMVFPVAAIVISVIAINCKSKEANEKKDNSITDITIPDDKEQAETTNKLTEGKTQEINELPLENTNKISSDSGKVYEKVEIEATFPGGANSWGKYLQRNLNASIPVDKGAPEGSYTVFAQFIVDVNGRVRDVKALTNHGYGMEDEVLRIIKKGPSWLPAIQNGRKVAAYRKQPVTFQIEAE